MNEMQEIIKLVNEIFIKYQKGNGIQIPAEYEYEYKIFVTEEYKKNGNSARSYVKRVFMRDKALHSDSGIQLKKMIHTLYVEQQMGYKNLSKLINLSYSECRTLLRLLNIEVRTGYDVVTEPLHKFRRDKCKSEYENGIGWFDTTSLCGYGIRRYK